MTFGKTHVQNDVHDSMSFLFFTARNSTEVKGLQAKSFVWKISETEL